MYAVLAASFLFLTISLVKYVGVEERLILQMQSDARDRAKSDAVWLDRIRKMELNQTLAPSNPVIKPCPFIDQQPLATGCSK
jgi:hypothetical protein